METRHPYVDIRLLRFMLSVPALPWCRRKHIVRCATRGVLPEAVRSRPKTPLNGHPECEQVKRRGMPPMFKARALVPYVDATRLSGSPARTVTSVQSDLLLVAFSYWLRDRESIGSSQRGDEQYEITGEVVGSGRL
jgi:asparagine synthase (glutamine-hydrolysing)